MPAADKRGKFSFSSLGSTPGFELLEGLPAPLTDVLSITHLLIDIYAIMKYVDGSISEPSGWAEVRSKHRSVVEEGRNGSLCSAKMSRARLPYRL
jgi:hypothetical protein